LVGWVVVGTYLVTMTVPGARGAPGRVVELATGWLDGCRAGAVWVIVVDGGAGGFVITVGGGVVVVTGGSALGAEPPSCTYCHQIGGPLRRRSASTV
jgi:hypothetical protein